MALPWLTLAKAVPWSDVIEHAPSVVNAARKLLQRKPVDPTSGNAPVVAEQAEAAQLRAQLAATQQLLQDLAEQQARTLAQVEENRIQLDQMRKRLMAVAVVAAISAVLVVGMVAKVAL